jgi:hypothetical protein
MTTLREAAEIALDALNNLKTREPVDKEIAVLRAALAQPEQKPVAWMDREGDIYPMPEIDGWAPPHTMLYTLPPQRKPMTDDNGKGLQPQYRVIEQHGRWQLVYDLHQIGNTARHEFRILKLRHDIAIYPGISLIEAQKRFRERVESDNE